MQNNLIAQLFAKELESEYTATRKCLERIPDSLYSYKPHPRSMELGYLAVLVAEIPGWIPLMINDGVIDFATYKRFQLSTAENMLQHFEDCYKEALQSLRDTTDVKLEDKFILQRDGKQIMASSKKESIGSALNHWVHHRGQLTVYMRLNEIPVPSIYGPSADDKTF